MNGKGKAMETEKIRFCEKCGKEFNLLGYYFLDEKSVCKQCYDEKADVYMAPGTNKLCPKCSTPFTIMSLNDLSEFKCLCGTWFDRYGKIIVKANILQEADKLTAGDRRQEYGHPKDNFADIAKMWSVVLGVEVKPLQVVEMMVCLKLCREKGGYKRDSWIDIAGYARCAELIQEE